MLINVCKDLKQTLNVYNIFNKISNYKMRKSKSFTKVLQVIKTYTYLPRDVYRF